MTMRTRRLRVQTCDFRTLQSLIFAKTKKFVKQFLVVYMGPMYSRIWQQKNNCRKSRDSVPLSPSKFGARVDWIWLSQTHVNSMAESDSIFD